VHPILFLLRCYFDKTHDQFTPESTIYYDSYVKKIDEGPANEGFQGETDQYTNDPHTFHSWDKFVEDRDYYFNLGQE